MSLSTIQLDLTGIKLVSFDVFDTVIARKCGAPEAVFHLTGHKLKSRGLLSISPQDFARQRVEAEKRARQHSYSELSLADIYAGMNQLWFLPKARLQAVMECELETERDNLFAIPGMPDLVQQARRAGKRVVFVSDMYLPANFLRGALRGLDILKDDDRLYVSSQWGVSKADGGLFKIVLEQEKLAGTEMLHLGDSLFCDVQRAVEYGIQARQITRGALNRFEVALGCVETDTAGQSGSLAGLARLARFHAEDTVGHFVAARLGASVAGPIFSNYAEWVLRAAMKRNLKRLYFLARDGQALLRVCETLAPALGAGEIELSYLYGSRETWSPAALLPLDETAADFFARQIAWTASDWEHCVEYLGFTAPEIQRTSLPSKWNSLSRRDTGWKKQIFLDLAAHADLGLLLRQRLKEKASLAARYLSEQGLADQIPCGLVDCGWSGTWTDIIGDLIAERGGTRPLAFFIGRRQRKTQSRCETLAWMFDHQAGFGLKNIPDYFHVLVEFLLTADHGRTMGFEEANGRVRPMLAPVDWQGFTVESWEVFRHSMLAFAEAYAQQLQSDREMTDLRPVLNELLRLFWEQPTVAEARFFSGHTIGLSPTRTNARTISRPYVWSDVVRLALRKQLPGIPPFWWHEGALAQSDFGLRVSMGILWEGRELLRMLWRRGKSGLRPQQLACMLAASARRLKRGLEKRGDTVPISFESATVHPRLQAEPLISLGTAASSGRTIS